MGVVNNAWSPAQVETLRSMLSSGATMRAVAEAIGGDVSRNAVIGKAHRLGLCSTSIPANARIAKADKPKSLPKPRKAAVPKPKPEAVTVPDHRVSPRSSRPLPLFAWAERRDEPLYVGLLALGQRQCRFVVDAAFCGGATGGGSWCPHHARLVYAPAKKRRAA